MVCVKSCLCTFIFCVVCFLVNNAEGKVLPEKKSLTCVIGAGISGLATARYLRQYGVNFTVFEATNHVGGTWYFDPRVGHDENGVPLFTSMYKNLRTNTPRQTMEFGGFPMPEGTPSYPAGPCYYKYIKLFTKTFDLMKYIQFQQWVTSVKWTGTAWNVTRKQVETGEEHTNICDYVIVANGHYTNPKRPRIEGEELFKGNIIHSHDYREPETYRKKRVLLVGAGASGLDLAMHLSTRAAKLVHSHHLNYNQPDFSKTYVKKPDIKKFTPTGVVFVDDSFEEIDDVIFCTGYDFDFSFLDENIGVTATDKFVLPLYRYMVNIKHPSMIFVGLTKVTITRVNDVQAEYAAALIAGKFALPTAEKMLKTWLEHVYDLQLQNKRIVDVLHVGKSQDQYFANLTAEAGVVRAAPVLTEIMIFNAKNRLDDLLNYRDYDYRILDEYNYERKYNLRDELPCPIEL